MLELLELLAGELLQDVLVKRCARAVRILDMDACKIWRRLAGDASAAVYYEREEIWIYGS